MKCLLAVVLVACNAPNATADAAVSVAPTSSVGPSASAAATAAPSPKTLADFMPPELEGTKLERLDATDPLMALPSGLFAGAYLNNATHKSINVNIGKTLDLATSRAQFHKLKPGQTKDAPAAHLSFEGFDVQGFPVERTDYLGSHKSEAFALIADKVDVRVSVQPADDPDEAVELMKRFDLHAIEAFAKTL